MCVLEWDESSLMTDEPGSMHLDHDLDFIFKMGSWPSLECG
jgi:hypothetical protein